MRKRENRQARTAGDARTAALGERQLWRLLPIILSATFMALFDFFVVNVTGSVSLLGKTTLGLGGGVTADHVLYNFTGAGGSITTKVNNVLNGTLLAPNRMELCYLHVSTISRIASCAELTKQ